jgi:glycosyltransferase involved in cell wall biosynthesis
VNAPPPVAIVTAYYRPVLGGAESAAERLAAYLARRGGAVLVLTKRTARAHPPSEIVDGVRVLRLGPPSRRSPMGKWTVLPWMLSALLRRRQDYRVVCCIDFRGVGLAALAARALTRAPVVFQAGTDGTLDSHRLPAEARALMAPDWVAWPVRRAYRTANRFVCISRAIERETLDAGVPRDRVVYLPHPVDTRQYSPASEAERVAARAELHVPLQAAVVVFVGRLSREKGVMDLLEAWAGLQQPNAYLILVGPDMPGHPWDAGAEGRAFVARRGLDSQVRFAGAQRPDQVALWLRSADLAVHPSRFEAFGIAALEALATGLPVIASDVGGLRDLVEDGVNGLRVPSGNVAALRETLRRMVTDQALRRRLAAAAVASARAFDEQVVLGQFADLLDRLAGER